MKTLEQQLRQARQEKDPEEALRIKKEMGIMTRNLTFINTYDKQGQLLSVRQSSVVVPIDEQKETVEKDVYL